MTSVSDCACGSFTTVGSCEGGSGDGGRGTGGIGEDGCAMGEISFDCSSSAAPIEERIGSGGELNSFLGTLKGGGVGSKEEEGSCAALCLCMFCCVLSRCCDRGFWFQIVLSSEHDNQSHRQGNIKLMEVMLDLTSSADP